MIDMNQEIKIQEDKVKKNGNISTTELRDDFFVKYYPKSIYDYRIGIFQTRLYYDIKNLRNFSINKILDYSVSVTNEVEVKYELIKEKQWKLDKESVAIIAENMAKIHNFCYKIREYVDLPKKDSLYDNMEEWYKIYADKVVKNEYFYIRRNIFKSIKRLNSKQVKIPLHRDFRKHNILWDGEKYILIDFDFAAHDFISIEISAFISDIIDYEDNDKTIELIKIFIENYYKYSEIKEIIWSDIVSDYLNYLCVNTFPFSLKERISKENFELLLEQRTKNLYKLYKYQKDIERIIEKTIKN